jgi:CubicO group peptidase (beta-lactamase class C family)
MSRFAAVLMFGLAVATPTFADAVDDLVRAAMKRQKVPGLTLAVVKDGKVVKAQGYGLANVEHQVPAKRETVYQSGSVGKMFTAAAVLLLVEDGKLTLDDSVRKHLPDAPESWQGVTVRHLLTHTAGIRNFTLAVNLQRDYTDEELLKKAFDATAKPTPGEKWAYSNTGYATLGILVTKVGGKFYGDLLKERVFAPLKMSTARIISEEDIVPNRAAGYRLLNNEVKNQAWVSPSMNRTADGSLYLTVDDLVKWDAALGKDGLLKESSWKEIWTPATLKDSKTVDYGMGWQVTARNGHRRQHHGGAWQGFTTYFDRYPDDKLTVIVLCNLSAPAGKPGEIAAAVAAEYVPDLAGTEK